MLPIIFEAAQFLVPFAEKLFAKPKAGPQKSSFVVGSILNGLDAAGALTAANLPAGSIQKLIQDVVNVIVDGKNLFGEFQHGS